MNNLATLAAQCRTCAALVGQPLRDNLLAVAVEAEQIKKDSARLVITADRLIKKVDAEMAAAAKAVKESELPPLVADKAVNDEDLEWQRHYRDKLAQRQQMKQIAVSRA